MATLMITVFYLGAKEAPQLRNFTGKYVQLQLPTQFEKMVEEFEMVRLIDHGYILIKNLTGKELPRGYRPPWGYPTYFSENMLLVIRYNDSIDFAHWGNPIQIGSSYWGAQEPKWSIIFHEMGHNFQTSHSYMKLLLERGDRVGDFVEGFASIASMYVLSEFLSSPETYQVSPAIGNQISRHYAVERGAFQESYMRWRTGGGGLDTLDGNSSAGFLLRLAEEHGWSVFRRFFHILNSIDISGDGILSKTDTEVRRATFLAAALSVSSGKDIAAEFTVLRIPIDRDYYESLLTELRNYV